MRPRGERQFARRPRSTRSGRPRCERSIRRGPGYDETIARAAVAGAEDYVVKPFSPTELTAHIRATLRRRSNPVPFVLGELAIDYDRRRVSVAGRPVTLTPTEYELLRVLAQGAGRILTHEDLLRQVWAGRGHGKKPTPKSCAPTSSGCATGSATTPPAQPGSSTSAGSATAWPAPASRASPDHRPQLRNTEPTRATAVADPHVS